MDPADGRQAQRQWRVQVTTAIAARPILMELKWYQNYILFGEMPNAMADDVKLSENALS